MSIEIDWTKLLEDGGAFQRQLRDVLDSHFQTMQLPSFIESLRVSSLDLGTSAPEITIRHISDPYPEFYEESDSDSDGSQSELSSSVAGSGSRAESAEPAMNSDLWKRNFPRNSEVDDQTNQNGLLSPSRGLSHAFPRPSVGGVLGYSWLGRGLSTAGLGDPLQRPDPQVSGNDDFILANAFNGVGGTLIGLRGDEQPERAEDLQLFIEVKYNGDLQLGVAAKLLVNYPSPSFISLPLEFQIRGFEIHCLAAVAYVSKRVHISILCDVDDDDQMLSENVQVIKTMKLESKIGDDRAHGAVLHNVGKVESFILEQLRRVIRDELVWPGWITLEF